MCGMEVASGGDGVCEVWRLLVVVMVYVRYGGC